MTAANIHRLIGVAAPLWAGEAEVVRSYWSSPKRTRDSDLLWLRRQCFKEFWGSGVGKYDRGGVVLGQLKNLLARGPEIDVTIDRYEILDALDGVRAEYSHISAPRNAISSVQICPVLRHATLSGPCWSMIALNFSVNNCIASSQSAAS